MSTFWTACSTCLWPWNMQDLKVLVSVWVSNESLRRGRAFRRSHMVQRLTEAGHLEVVSLQTVAQHFHPLLLQLQDDLESRE